jgi:predicted nucleotidyltransferase
MLRAGERRGLPVVFQPGAERPWAGHYQDLQADLNRLLGRDVDLISKAAVEQSRNWVRREAILREARLLYGT